MPIKILLLFKVVLSDKAQADGLGVSLMERLALRHPERVALLSTQYRSNELISGWSSSMFYNGMLQADSSVARFESILSSLQSSTSRPLTALGTSCFFVKINFMFGSSRGGLGVERLLHKKHDCAGGSIPAWGIAPFICML